MKQRIIFLFTHADVLSKRRDFCESLIILIAKLVMVVIELAALPILMHKTQQCQALRATLLTLIYYMYILVYCIY